MLELISEARAMSDPHCSVSTRPACEVMCDLVAAIGRREVEIARLKAELEAARALLAGAYKVIEHVAELYPLIKESHLCPLPWALRIEYAAEWLGEHLVAAEDPA